MKHFMGTDVISGSYMFIIGLKFLFFYKPGVAVEYRYITNVVSIWPRMRVCAVFVVETKHFIRDFKKLIFDFRPVIFSLFI
jgi:hypothetical protein